MKNTLSYIYRKNWQYNQLNDINKLFLILGTIVFLMFFSVLGIFVEKLIKIQNITIYFDMLIFFFLFLVALLRVPYVLGFLNNHCPNDLKKKLYYYQKKKKTLLAWKKPHLYTLGLRNLNASEQEIKVAFRKLAMQYHPDRNSDPQAHVNFQKVKLAYEHLKNKQFIKN